MSKSTGTSTRASETTSSAPSDPTVVNNGTSIKKYARGLNEYKAGQSPATLYPARTRSFQPGLSWLGDDEFESTGLAFRLARHHVQRATASKSVGVPGPRENENLGSGPRRNDERTRTRVTALNNADEKAPRPKRDPAQKPRLKQAGVVEAKVPETVEPGISTGPATSRPTLKPSHTPLHVDLGSTDFTSLFGASPYLSATPVSTNTKTILADNVSRRVQLALEHGGDYSNLVSGTLVTSQGSPITYAENTMGRRRDLGPDGRNAALKIIRGMIGRPQGSQPTT